MVTPDAKRKAVAHACTVHAVSQRRACLALTIDRSTVRYTSTRPDDALLREASEVRRFISGDYDVVLGMLERRLDDQTHGGSRVRRTVAAILRSGAMNPAAIHKALKILSDRGAARTIVTTNFDLLLEVAARRSRASVQTYSLGAIPRPSRQPDFSGVLHIHGALDRSADRTSELVLSDQDFGEVYLRRRVVPDFIYDAACLYHLVLVGYSANDAPMRYLLNAVACQTLSADFAKTVL